MKEALITINESHLDLLERLCNAVAVSGAENEVRRIVISELKDHADEITVDALGNVLVKRLAKNGGATPLNVMLDAHMDEVGFMIADDEGEGIYSFEVVGGIDKRQLPGKQVWVGKDHLPGVIGVKPVHLLKDDEWKSAIPVDSLRIDLGPGADGKVKRGDYGTFATRFLRSGEAIFAKALDDRLGVAILIEMVKRAPDHINLLASFSVQEEIGLRGARVSAYSFDPDVAIAVDSTPARDMPREDGEENCTYNTRFGAGPAVYLYDAGTVSDQRLVRFLQETAQENGIPCQLRQPGKGGTNAGSIHKVHAGVPSVSVSVPGRYAHTAILLACIPDWQNTMNMIHLALQKITPSLLNGARD